MAKQARSPDARFGIFEDPETDWVFHRTLSYIVEKGAELGECLYTARTIDETDGDSWIEAWAAIATQVEALGDKALADGHCLSARECFLRASNYYRTAEYGAPPEHPRFLDLWTKSTVSFRKAGELFPQPIELVFIEFEGKKLPGYFWRPDASGTLRPTLVAAGGNDSSLAEVVFLTGMAAVKRGYNFFTFEHPGHRGAVHLYPDCVKRPDYEVPYGAALDYLARLPGVDDRIALTGYSYGGYVACRVATREPRIQAVIPNPPFLDLYSLFTYHKRGWILSTLPSKLLNRMIEKKMRVSPLRYALAKYMSWTFGRPNQSWIEFASFDMVREFEVGGELHGLDIPALALVGGGEGEEVMRQTQQFYDTIASKEKRLHTFTINSDRANDHCQFDNHSRANQVMYDWLDDIFGYRVG